MDKKKKYIIGGICFVVISFITALFVFLKTYALEGFGELNLSCNKTVGVTGDEVECQVTGTAASNNSVASLSSQLKLSDNLELISITTDEIWNGDGENGDIQLYFKDDYANGTFGIVKFKVKIIDMVSNVAENIKLTENIFYDEKSGEHKIEDVTLDINTPHYSSEKYDLTKEYIVVDSKDVQSILKNIKTQWCDVVISNNDNIVNDGNIANGYKLQIVIRDNDNTRVIKEFALVYFDSQKYDLSTNYILVPSESNNNLDVTNDIECINCAVNIKNDQLVLSYNSVGIKNYNILNVYSDVYKLDLMNNYLLINEVINNDVLNNVKIGGGDNVGLSLEDNKLNIKYNEEKIKILNVIYIYSNKYNVDFNKDYIYVDSDNKDDVIKSNVFTNVDLSIVDNKLKLDYEDNTLVELDIINVYSDKYYIDNDNSYIYTNVDSKSDVIKSNILTSNNADLLVDGNKLKVKHKKYVDEVIKEFDLYYISSSNYRIENDKIYTKGLVDYSSIEEKISFNGLDFKLFDTFNNEVNSGNIGNNFVLKLYKNDKELDSYEIISEYLEIENLMIDEENKIIYNLTLGTTYNDVLKNINTSGEIEILTLGENPGYVADTLVDNYDSKVSSHSVIKIKMGTNVIEYKFSVFGDVAGNPNNLLGSVRLLYQGVKKREELNIVSILAGDVTRDGKIAINDVAKLYQYHRGILDSLD